MTPMAENHSRRTAAEEAASTAVQAFGTVISAIGLVFLIIHAVPLGALPVTSVSIYGAALVMAFLASALYHGIRNTRIKRVFRTIDHCTIYLLIAGTYTPVALLVLKGTSAWALVAAVWALAATGIVLRILWPGRFAKLRIGLYLLLGWLVIAWAKSVYEGLGLWGSVLLVSGGLVYSLGVVFYAWKKLPFNQAVWHLFVVAGSACFFAAIAFHVLPSHAV